MLVGYVELLRLDGFGSIAGYQGYVRRDPPERLENFGYGLVQPVWDEVSNEESLGEAKSRVEEEAGRGGRWRSDLRGGEVKYYAYDL